MNYNHNNSSRNHWRVTAVLTVCFVLVVCIVYMKHSASEQKVMVPSSPAQQPAVMAVPDTSVGTDVLPEPVDTVIPSTLPDTLLGKDKRVPFEAGYEDGYTAGCDDGATGQERASYDESNSFSTPKEQEEYVKGYQEGYDKGVEDGRQGKQFNI